MRDTSNPASQPGNQPFQQQSSGQPTTVSADRLKRERIAGGNLLLYQQSKVWSGIEVARYRFPPGERRVEGLPGHLLRLHQSDPHYFVQRLDGRTQASTETSNLVTIIPADHPFEQVFQVESDDLNVVLPDRVIRRAAADSQIYPDRIEILDRFCQDDPHVRRIGLTLGAELEGESLGEQLYAESLAYALAVHMVRKYSTVSTELFQAIAQQSEQGLSQQVLVRITDYIGDNLARRLTLAEIAGAANLSPFHFSRLFKASTGLTPHQYVVEQRLQHARELLMRTDLPLHEIAWQVGFADQSHLGRHMRRRYGLTPGSFR
jgi:AraC family transcriptional regulator